WRSFDKTNSNYPSGRILGIKTYKEVIWMCFASTGLVKFEKGSFTTFNTANSNIPTNNVVRLNIDESGIIWIVTTQKMLVRYDGKTFTKFTELRKNVPLPDMLDIG